MALQMTLGQHEKLMGAGLGAGILTNLQTYYDTLIDFAMASGLRNPRRYYIDPRSDASLQAQQSSQEQSAAAQAERKALENRLLETQINTELLKVQGNLAQSEQKTGLEYYKAVLDAALKQLELVAEDGETGDQNAEVDALQAVGTIRSVE